MEGSFYSSGSCGPMLNATPTKNVPAVVDPGFLYLFFFLNPPCMPPHAPSVP